MRDLKFRAWYHAEGDALHYSRGKLMNPDRMFYDDWPGECLLYAHQGQPVVIEQFTGLKDRNGREIYEGDIVRLTLGDVPLIAHVKWEHFSWYFLETVGGFPLCNIPDCLEVIGNIHEHPELLQ